MVHCLLGHLHEDAARKAAKYLGWEISRGSMSQCEHCTKAKAKQKNVVKESKAVKAEHPGECIYLDLSKVMVSKSDGTEFVVDEYTGKKWCDFMDTKIGMVERTCEFLSLMKT